MKIRVLSQNAISVSEFKKVIDIFKESACPNESLRATFTDRYAGILKPNKKLTEVFFDSKIAKAHKYEFEI